MKNLAFISLFFSLNSFSQSDCAKFDIDFTGFCSELYPNGKIKWIKELKEGLGVGIWMYFDENGNLKKQLNTNSKRDSLDNIYIVNEIADKPYTVIAEIVDVDVVKGDIYTFVKEEAEFPGGIAKMNEWIQKNLIYPADLMDITVMGKCYLKFVVEIDGQISNVTVVKGIPGCPQCDNEAVRLVKSMPLWKPGRNSYKAVRSWCQIPINFTLK